MFDPIYRQDHLTFQSTPSAWRETCLYFQSSFFPQHFNPLPPHGGRQQFPYNDAEHQDFNPLPPHGGRRGCNRRRVYCRCISIHSLRMEGDDLIEIVSDPAQGFQSTPSAWRETTALCSTGHWIGHFNPLPPHGGRLFSLWVLIAILAFQSTPSAWRETRFRPVSGEPSDISIHSLRMEGDKIYVMRFYNDIPFQSTPSAWRETNGLLYLFAGVEISIHSLRMEGDGRGIEFDVIQCISIHSLRMEGDAFLPESFLDDRHFNPLPPHGGRLMCGTMRT